MMNFLAYADGSSDLLEIAETIDIDVAECAEIAKRLLTHGLIE
jgi:aminopeptidase-like protein